MKVRIFITGWTEAKNQKNVTKAQAIIAMAMGDSHLENVKKNYAYKMIENLENLLKQKELWVNDF